MQSIPVANFEKDARYDGFLLVRSADKRSASNGTQYIDLTLGDKTGDINAKVWDGNIQMPPVGVVIRVRGQLHEYNGRLQLRVERLRLANENDEIPLESLVPCAPHAPEDMLAEINAAVEAMQNQDLRALVSYMLNDVKESLLFFPAAAKLHHAERGGLLHHITTMMRMANHFADEYPLLDRDLLIAGVIVHDLAKIGELNASDLGTVSDYTVDGLLIGHLVRGVARIEAASCAVGCDRELSLMLQHMVLSHHGIPEYGSPKPPMFPEAEVLNHLDMLDARIYEMNAALSRVRPGGFSERLWSLERKLYRRQGDAPTP